MLRLNPRLSTKAGSAQVQGRTEERQGALGVFEQFRSLLKGVGVSLLRACEGVALVTASCASESLMRLVTEAMQVEGQGHEGHTSGGGGGCSFPLRQ